MPADQNTGPATSAAPAASRRAPRARGRHGVAGGVGWRRCAGEDVGGHGAFLRVARAVGVRPSATTNSPATALIADPPRRTDPPPPVTEEHDAPPSPSARRITRRTSAALLFSAMHRRRADPRPAPLPAASRRRRSVLLGVVEARLDAAFRAHFAALAVVGLWLGRGVPRRSRSWPSVGAVLVACFYPSRRRCIGAPGPGGAGTHRGAAGRGVGGYAAPARRSLVGRHRRGARSSSSPTLACTASAWDTIFFPAVFYPAPVGRRARPRERERSAAARSRWPRSSTPSARRRRMPRSSEERTRIAREVHDAVAHSVSVMTLQIGGLRRQLDDVLEERPAERDVHARPRAARPAVGGGARGRSSASCGSAATPTPPRPPPVPGAGRRSWWPTCGRPGCDVDADGHRRRPASCRARSTSRPTGSCRRR